MSITGTKYWYATSLKIRRGHSRSTQLILAYQESLHLGGGSPWEVPFAQLVGEESYRTLSKFYTGYGEEVKQGKLMNQGNAYLEKEFPLLDYITG